MVYNIVTRICKGHIYIEGQEGKGTRVHLYLPKAQSATHIKEADTVDIEGGTVTILVVDDEPMVIKLIQRLLTSIGYTVETARDGEEALELYKKEKDFIDAVILDLTMPRMSGQMVLQELLEESSEVKVIVSSGHSEEYAMDGILAKAKGNVTKPYKLRDFAPTVRSVLDS